MLYSGGVQDEGERELHMHWSLGRELASIFQLVSEEVHCSNPQRRAQLTFLT